MGQIQIISTIGTRAGSLSSPVTKEEIFRLENLVKREDFLAASKFYPIKKEDNNHAEKIFEFIISR